MSKKIKIAIMGLGNCSCSLIQGIHYYSKDEHMPKNPEDPKDFVPGLMHWDLAGYKPGDIEVVAAFDVDRRKVGRDVSEAIFQRPNCTKVFEPDIPEYGVTVHMGVILDGVAPHMANYPEDCAFSTANEIQPSKEQIVEILKKSEADIVVNYLPVGSQKAVEFYAECTLEAGCGIVNCIPVFIASDPEWEEKFAKANLPIVGDDIKSQVGATIVHRILTDLFKKRGVPLDTTYQINFGGNTDFLNMLNRDRLVSKKISKTEAVQCQAKHRLSDRNIHVGPSDYIPWLDDNKICNIKMNGRLFGDVPMDIELRLSVEDSPNSAGVVIDAVRCCKLALDRETGGCVYPASAYFMKHPPKQYQDDVAYRLVESFIIGGTE